MSDGPKMKTLETLRRWHFAIGISHKAHIKAAAMATRYNTALGIPTVVLSAVVGTAVFSTLEKSPGTEARLIIASMSILSAVLAALQTYLRLGDRAEQYRRASFQYGDLRRQVEEVLGSHSDEEPCEVSFLEGVRKTWGEIDKSAPTLSQRLYGRVLKDAKRPAQDSPHGAAPLGPPDPHRDQGLAAVALKGV